MQIAIMGRSNNLGFDLLYAVALFLNDCIIV